MDTKLLCSKENRKVFSRRTSFVPLKNENFFCNEYTDFKKCVLSSFLPHSYGYLQRLQIHYYQTSHTAWPQMIVPLHLLSCSKCKGSQRYKEGYNYLSSLFVW
jgi:hypothetical protein